MDEVMICHGMITHSPRELCEFCQQVKDRFEEDFQGTYYRTGIKTVRNDFICMEICDEHRFCWLEGDNYREFGGHACRECIERAQIIPFKDGTDCKLDKCYNKC